MLFKLVLLLFVIDIFELLGQQPSGIDPILVRLDAPVLDASVRVKAPITVNRRTLRRNFHLLISSKQPQIVSCT